MLLKKQAMYKFVKLQKVSYFPAVLSVHVLEFSGFEPQPEFVFEIYNTADT